MRLKSVTPIIASTILATIMGTAMAETSPEDAYKYRDAVMGSMGSHIAAIVMIFTGKVDYPDQLAIHASALAEVAATAGSIFPAGSDVDDSDALPLIWQEPEEFSQAAQNVADATAALAAAVNTGDRGATAKAFKGVGEACKGCHDRFRADDDDDHDHDEDHD